MKKYFFILLSAFSVVVYGQDCDELPKRSSATVFPSIKGLEFGGVDEVVNCGDHNDFSFTNGSGQDQPFSLFTWMNRTSSGTNHTLIAKTGEYILWLVGTTVYFQCFEWGTTMIWATGPMSTTGTWIGIAATYDGSESQNGLKIYSVTPAGTVTQIDNFHAMNNNYLGMQNGNTPLKIGAPHGPNAYFQGKLAAPLLATKELSTSELAEIATVQNGDYRKVSFYNNIVSAWYFPNGQNDYPTYTDYKSGHNGTMTNMESTDIILETPK